MTRKIISPARIGRSNILKFGGKDYHYNSLYRTKVEAQSGAKKARSKGWFARIVPGMAIDKDKFVKAYGVYVRR